VGTLVVVVDREDRLVFPLVPLMSARVHLFKPMVEMVVDLVSQHQLLTIVVEGVVEEV